VAQIARSISRALRLNEDLTEAIALGHDLGHTPFGHTGEEVLNVLFTKGFAHAEQSLRVVDYLERGGKGLNLTWEVRQGVLHHSKSQSRTLDAPSDVSLPLEALVCRLADAVAYVNHDIADAIRAGMISEDDLPASSRKLLGTNHSQRINSLVRDIVASSHPAAGEGRLEPSPKPIIAMSQPVRGAMNDLWCFLSSQVYDPRGYCHEAQIARKVVTFLYEHFTVKPEQMPHEYVANSDSPARAAVDYIAGMTDYFALHTSESIQPGITEGLLPWRV
jgi:dGTPase